MTNRDPWCLGHCSEEIVWQELQKALAPNILIKLLQRRQSEEVVGCWDGELGHMSVQASMSGPLKVRPAIFDHFFDCFIPF